jgi:hypothetical protein
VWPVVAQQGKCTGMQLRGSFSSRLPGCPIVDMDGGRSHSAVPGKGLGRTLKMRATLKMKDTHLDLFWRMRNRAMGPPLFVLFCDFVLAHAQQDNGTCFVCFVFFFCFGACAAEQWDLLCLFNFFLFWRTRNRTM